MRRLFAFFLRLLWWRRKPEAEPELIPTNRAMRRAFVRSLRLKGPGYTRKMRKGRTQRERPS